MRDPKRIDRMIETLRKVWKRNPNWRLGQLIVNAMGVDRIFYVEDSALENELEVLLDKSEEDHGTFKVVI